MISRSSGAQDPGQLGHGPVQVLDVHEGECAHGGIDRPGVDGQVVEVALEERASGQLRSGPGEHVRRLVDADDRVATVVQMDGISTRATGGVQRDAGRQRIDELSIGGCSMANSRRGRS